MTRLEEIAKRAEDVRRSDDFGHDTYELLQWEARMCLQFQEVDVPYLLGLIASLEAEVTCLRSVLSEWDTDKSCYTQMIQADQIAKEREKL